MITFAGVDVGRGGLPSCPECGDQTPLEMRSAADVVSDVRRAIEAWHHGPGPNVSLGGGEAFAHPELPVLVSETLRQGVERLKLTTAGPALAQGLNATGVVDAGVRHIEVVVLSVQQGDRPRAQAAAFESVGAGISAFLEVAKTRGARVAVVARVMTCPHTYATAPTTVAALASAGAVTITIELRPGITPTHTWISSVIDSGVVNRAWVQFETSMADRTVPALSPLPGVDTGSARAWRDVGAPL